MPENEPETPERVQKILARVGIGSRRICEDLIEAGAVSINGKVARLGDRAVAATDVIEVDGVRIGTQPGLVYYLLNKPAGVITSATDTHGRPVVTDLVPSEPRVFPVGRLDQDTEGLLLLTNDGALTQRLTHPSYGVEKEYLVELDGAPTRAELRRLREGVELDDGITAPAKVSTIEPSVVRITIHEGRNRQVRRMFEVIGRRVVRLVRTRIGPVVDRRLAPGQWRGLTTDEVRELERATTAAHVAGTL